VRRRRAAAGLAPDPVSAPAPAQPATVG